MKIFARYRPVLLITMLPCLWLILACQEQNTYVVMQRISEFRRKGKAEAPEQLVSEESAR